MTDRMTKYMPVWGRHVEVLDKLSDEALGELFRAMMHYHFDETEPELSGVLEVYWDFMKPDLDNARSNYEKKAESGRKGGKRSGEVRREQKEANASTTKQNEQIESESKTESKSEAESETDTESDGSFAPAEAGISLEQRAYGEYGWVKLTERQDRQLLSRMGEKTLGACIRCIDRSAQSANNRNRWKDWYLVLCRCYEEGWHEPRGMNRFRSPPSPTVRHGPSGGRSLLSHILKRFFLDNWISLVYYCINTLIQGGLLWPGAFLLTVRFICRLPSGFGGRCCLGSIHRGRRFPVSGNWHWMLR